MASIHSDSDTEISGASSNEDSDGEDSNDKSIDGESSEDGLPLDRPDPYNSDFSSTTITFSHASIRDYLVRESNPAKRDFHTDLGIGISVPDAEKHITTTCLMVLTGQLKLPYRQSDKDTDSESSSESGEDDGNSDIHSDEIVSDLQDYAADHFIDHLSRTDRVTITSEEQQTITTSLLSLFTDNDAIDNWINVRVPIILI